MLTHSYNKKKLDQLKTDNSSYIHVSQVVGQTISPKSREIGNHGLLIGAKAAGGMNRQKPLNGNFDELLEAECGRA